MATDARKDDDRASISVRVLQAHERDTPRAPEAVKCFLVLACAILALTLLWPASPPSKASPLSGLPAGQGGILGDADCSGSVNPVDSLVILRQDGGLADAPCGEVADVQCDGDVDPIDSLQILRWDGGLAVSQEDGCGAIGEPGGPEEIPPTSEALIAAALEASDITYEDSLRFRAFALYNDPRLPEEFRSPIMDLEAASALFAEVYDAEGQLSQSLLDDLAPFRARPNDPISVLYDVPIAGAAPQGALAWQSALVPGTDARVWAFGPPGAQEPFIDAVSMVWNSFLGTFAYPNPDQTGDPSPAINPDTAIDIYVVDINGIDPRADDCQQNPSWCTVGSRDGFAQRAAPFVSNKSSGYLVINARSGGQDNLVDTVAHELAHVSQFAYDRNESLWLMESTATWVAYRVMLDLGKTPQWEYNRAEELFQSLEETLNRSDPSGADDRYGSWLFFQHAAMVAGDGIVSAVWQDATALGTDDIDSVDAVFPLDEHFDDFAVRNWNDDPVATQYKDAPDLTFPDIHPELDRDITVSGEADYTLDLPVEALSARYYRYVFQGPVRHIIFENNLVGTDHARVWLLENIGGDWKPPTDMEGKAVKTWCRDHQNQQQIFDQDLREVIVIVSYSALSGPPLEHPRPRVIADEIACLEVFGTVYARLDVENDT